MADLRERLVDAAQKLIVKHGVEGFSLREAARLVKVDPAMVYRSFAGKDDLVRAVADRGFTELAEGMRSAARRCKSTEAVLKAYGRVYLRFAFANPAVFRIMFGPARGSPLPVSGSPLELLAECAGALPGAKSPTQAAALCWAGMHGIAVLFLDGALERAVTVDAHTLSGQMIDALLLSLTSP